MMCLIWWPLFDGQHNVWPETEANSFAGTPSIGHRLILGEGRGSCVLQNVEMYLNNLQQVLNEEKQVCLNNLNSILNTF